ncbi:MAG: hypothetical protein WC545_00005 [Patescibacteria group bacterium]|jgi:dihydroorotate dehydrogenase
MEIKGIEFKVVAAAGARGWFGEGYWYHDLYKLVFPHFEEVLEKLSFVAETTTLNYRQGNLSLRPDDFTPIDLFPDCIKIYPLKGIMLNAVGLSGPGLRCLVERNQWQNIKIPFAISFMPVHEDLEGMIQETRDFVEVMQNLVAHKNFQAPIWLQINLSCPNTEHQTDDLIEKAEGLLQLFWVLREKYNILVDLKVNIFCPNELIGRIWERNFCDIITISNTIKWGSPGINWKKEFWWRRSSPLAKYGGGALSGRKIFPLVIKKIRSVRRAGIDIPLKVSGGIMSKKAVWQVKAAGGDAIEIATVISLRPWRLAGIAREAEKIF